MSYSSKDNKRCSLKQIAEALMLSAMDNKWNDYLDKHFDPSFLKSLDTFLTTVYRFTQIFRKNFKRIHEKYLISENWVSEEKFVSFLAPRCETLSQKKDHFGLILTCSFVGESLRVFRKHFKCLHYDSAAYKYLSGFLKSNFDCLENNSNWNSLMHYCRELNREIDNHKKGRIHDPWEKPPTPVGSDKDVRNETDKGWCECDLTRTCSCRIIEFQDIVTEEVKNLSKHLNYDIDEDCDQSFENSQSEVIFVVFQNATEKNRTQEISKNDLESNIGVNTTSDSSSNVTGNQTTNTKDRRKVKSDTNQTGHPSLLKIPDTDSEEVMNLNESLNATYKICDETLRMTLSQDMSDVSQKGENENNIPQDIKGDDNTQNIVSSSPIKEIESLYETTSSEDSTDGHASKIHDYYNLLMPGRPYKLEMLGLLKKCETEFDHTFPNRFNNRQPEKGVSSSSTTKGEESDKSSESKKRINNLLIGSKKKVRTPSNEHKPDRKKKGPQHCKNCEGLSFKVDFDERKRAFRNRYGNMIEVSYLFDLKISDSYSTGSESS